MKYLKKFKELNENISIFNQEWKKLIPKELTILTSNGEFPMKLVDLMINGNGDLMQIAYYHSSFNDDPNAVLDDGEPDYLEFDICFTKHDDVKLLRMLIDITYGDSMMFEFTVEPPNKIDVAHYNGIGSKYDPETFFSFDDESLEKLVDLLNKFSKHLKLSVDDFKFLDKEEDSFKFNHDVKSVSDKPEYTDHTKVNKGIPK